MSVIGSVEWAQQQILKYGYLNLRRAIKHFLKAYMQLDSWIRMPSPVIGARHPATSLTSGQAPEEVLINHILRDETINFALKQIKDWRQKQIIKLHLAEGRTQEEVARVLHISPSTVKKQLNKTLDAIIDACVEFVCAEDYEEIKKLAEESRKEYAKRTKDS